VVIATVFLTIISMTGGFVLGERRQDQQRAGAEQQQQQSATSPPFTKTNPTLPGAATGKLCPEQTLRTAERLGFSPTLRQVLKIETISGATAWICQDDSGGYFYQGKTGGPGQPLKEGANGLFLSKVVRSEDREEYVAVATNGNRFVVNRERLEVHFAKDNRTEVSEVVAAE
jgi:hypothetical protein